MYDLQLPDIKTIKSYLARHGISQTKIDSMSDEDIEKAYIQESKNQLSKAQELLKEDFIELQEKENENRELSLEELRPINANHLLIYTGLDDVIDNYSMKELAGLILTATQGMKLSKIEKMLRIKIRELQEFWLEALNENLKLLPDEERYDLMGLYDKQKDNLRLLKTAYENSLNAEYLENLKNLALNKLNMIKTYMPKDMETSYQNFFNNSAEKLKIVEEVLKISGAYTKETLLSLSLKELNELHLSIMEQEEEQAKERKQFNHFVKLFRNALNSSHEEQFADVILEAVHALPKFKFAELVNFMADSHKNFKNKFLEAAKEHKDFIDPKVLL